MLGIKQLRAQHRGVFGRIERAGADDAFGVFQINPLDIDRIIKHVAGIKEVLVRGRAKVPDLCAHHAAIHRRARRIARGGNIVPRIIRYAEMRQLFEHAVAGAGGVCDKHHLAAAVAIGLQRGDRIRQCFDPVVDAAPKVDEQGVIAVRDFEKVIDNLGHGPLSNLQELCTAESTHPPAGQLGSATGPRRDACQSRANPSAISPAMAAASTPSRSAETRSPSTSDW